MTHFSIVRIGNEYIVKVDEQSILKVSSRRKAAKLVSIAVELLDQDRVSQRDETLSIACDPVELP